MPRTPFLLSLGLSLTGAGLAAAQPAATTPSPSASVQRVQATAQPPAVQPSTTPPPVLPAEPVVLPCPVAASCDGPTVWFQADYLMWWLRPAPTPPLLTTSADPNDLGVIGNPTTTILFGGTDTSFSQVNGLRLFAGAQLNDVWGVQVGGFLLEQSARSLTVRSDSTGPPTIAIPTLNPDDESDDAIRITGPGALVGSATARVENRLWGMEANATAMLVDDPSFHLSGLVGYRYASLREQLRLDTVSALILPVPGLFPTGLFGQAVGPGTVFTGFDEFATRNTFNGAQLGVEGEWRSGRFFVGGFTKVGLGVTRERSAVKGGTTALLSDGTTGSANGSTLASITNIGQNTTDVFTVLPEVGANVGVWLNNYISVSAGYQFLYWSDVVRPGDQIDRHVNVNFLPTQDDGTRLGQPLPAPRFEQTDFWAHGWNVRLAIGW